MKHAYGIPPALWVGGPLPSPVDNSSPDDWTWEIKTAVDPTNGSAGQYSSLALDSNGNPHVVYFHSGGNDLEHAWATMKPRSGEWVWQSEKIDTVGKVGKHASLAIGPGDRLHVAYYDETNKALKHATKKLDHATGLGLSTWVVSTVDDPPSQNTDQGVGLYTDIIVADSGNVYIVYYDSANRDLKLAHN